MIELQAHTPVLHGPASLPDYAARYSGEEQVFLFSNELDVPKTAQEFARERARATGGVMVGVVGGVDTFLTYAAYSNTNRWIALDVNPYSLDYLTYRLALAHIDDDPLEYFSDLFFDTFDLTSFPMREAIRTIEESEAHADRLLRRLIDAYPARDQDRITSVTILANRLLRSLRPVQQTNDQCVNAIATISQAYEHEHYWLSFENPYLRETVTRFDTNGQISLYQSGMEDVATIIEIQELQAVGEEVAAVYLSDVYSQAKFHGAESRLLNALIQLQKRQHTEIILIDGRRNQLTSVWDLAR